MMPYDAGNSAVGPTQSSGAGHRRATSLHISQRSLSPPLSLRMDIHSYKFVKWHGKFCDSVFWGCLDEMCSMAYATNVS